MKEVGGNRQRNLQTSIIKMGADMKRSRQSKAQLKEQVELETRNTKTKRGKYRQTNRKDR